MAAAIASKYQGVAKRAQTVAVCVGCLSDSDLKFHPDRLKPSNEPSFLHASYDYFMAEATDLIIQDVLQRNLQGKAIIHVHDGKYSLLSNCTTDSGFSLV